MKKKLPVFLAGSILLMLCHGICFGAAQSSYPTKATVVDADKALITDSAASNATKQAAMSTIKSYMVGTGIIGDLIAITDDGSGNAALPFSIRLSDITGSDSNAIGNPGTNGYLLSATTDGVYSWVAPGAGGTWGSITGTLSDQSDLQAALDAISAGSIPHVSSGDPSTAGSWNYNTTDHKLRTRNSNGDVYVSSALSLETAADTTPTAFTFTDETNIAINTTKESAAITVAGINWPAAISVAGDTGYGYSKNSTGCTATSGTVVDGDTVAACITSSGSNGTATSSTVTIGGVSDTYTVTTVAGGITDDFSTDTSANYTAIHGSISISGGSLGGGTAWTQNYAIHNTSTGSNDHYVQGKIQTGGVSAGGAIGLRSNGTTGYLVCLNVDATRLTLFGINGATLTINPDSTAYKSITGSGGAGSYTVKLSISGNIIHAYIDLNDNGTFVDSNEDLGTWTISSYTSGQYVVVGALRGSDNVDYRVDYLLGGAL